MSHIDKDYKYPKDKRPEIFYISPRFKHYNKETYWRFGNRVFPSEAMPEVVKEKGELILRTTNTGVQQIKAKFLEDSRQISHLWFQRWNTSTDYPIGQQIVLYGDQIPRLIEFLSVISKLEIPHDEKFNRRFDDLRLVHMPDEDARKVLEDHPDLVAEFARSKITTEDVVALAYRRKELETFQLMLKKRRCFRR